MNIREILSDHKIAFLTESHRHARSGWVQVDCPWCGPGSNRFHLGFNEARGSVSCWRCGRHGLAETLAVLCNISKPDAWKFSKSIDRIKAPRREHTGTLQVPTGLVDRHPAHENYLTGRHFDVDSLIDVWGIRFLDQDALKLKWRVWIPIHYDGEVVSWTTRSIAEDAHQRYLSASSEQESIPHKTLLYGEDYASHSIIIHEGPTDVWATGPGAVGTLGTSFTHSQMVRMTKYQIRVVCFDSEPVAQERARALCDMLSIFEGETFNARLDAKDAATAPRREIKRLRRLAGLV